MAANGVYEVNEDDCCRNGCVNCILETPVAKFTKPKIEGKINIMLTFNPYQLLECKEIRSDLWEMHFKCILKTPDPNLILYIPPGHHIMMKAPAVQMDDSQSKVEHNSYITRPYTPFWSNVEDLEFKILVNFSPNGLMSKFIKTLQLGDEVYFRGPVGKFQHKPTAYDNLLLFCHGVAIAPIMSIINGILDDEEDVTKIRLFACFENMEKIIFREKLHDFNRYWNFSGKVYLAHPEGHYQQMLKYRENIFAKRLNSADVKQAIADCQGAKSLKCVICGSKQFQELFKAILVENGVNESAIEIL